MSPRGNSDGRRSWSGSAECPDGVGKLDAGLAKASAQVITVGVVDPPVKASSKDRNSDVREQRGARRLTTSPNQLGRQYVGDGGELGPSPLLQLGAASDDLAALHGVQGDLGAQHRSNVGERREQRLKRGELRGGPLERLSQQPRQPLGAGKEHVALVGEVAGERAPGQSGPVGDLRNGDVLVAELEEELDRGGPQSFFCLRVPPGIRSAYNRCPSET